MQRSPANRQITVAWGKRGADKIVSDRLFNSQLTDSDRSRIVHELFTQYHLAQGMRPDGLRFDRTVLHFGRRKSAFPRGRRSSGGQIR
jgi:hypothetical protein